MTHSPKDMSALVEQLAELLVRATPGDWTAERRRSCSVVLQVGGPHDGYSNRVAECPQWSPAAYPKPTPDEAFANAVLIAAMRTALPALLSERASLAAEIAALQAKVGEARGAEIGDGIEAAASALEAWADGFIGGQAPNKLRAAAADLRTNKATIAANWLAEKPGEGEQQ